MPRFQVCRSCDSDVLECLGNLKKPLTDIHWEGFFYSHDPGTSGRDCGCHDRPRLSHSDRLPQQPAQASRPPVQPEAARRAGIRVRVCAAVTVTLAGAPQARGAARLVRVISSESHLAATVGGTAHAGRNQKLRRHAASRPAPLRRLSPAASERYQVGPAPTDGGPSRIPATARTPHFIRLHCSWGPVGAVLPALFPRRGPPCRATAHAKGDPAASGRTVVAGTRPFHGKPVKRGEETA